MGERDGGWVCGRKGRHQRCVGCSVERWMEQLMHGMGVGGGVKGCEWGLGGGGEVNLEVVLAEGEILKLKKKKKKKI